VILFLNIIMNVYNFYEEIYILSKSALFNRGIALQLTLSTHLLVYLVSFSQDNILQSPEDSENVSYEKKIGSTGDYEMFPRVFVLINVGRWIDKCVLVAFSPNFCPLPFFFLFFSDYYSCTFPPLVFLSRYVTWNEEEREEEQKKYSVSFFL